MLIFKISKCCARKLNVDTVQHCNITTGSSCASSEVENTARIILFISSEAARESIEMLPQSIYPIQPKLLYLMLLPQRRWQVSIKTL